MSSTIAALISGAYSCHTRQCRRSTLLAHSSRNVSYWHLADLPLALTNVCFEGENGHDADVTRCLLMTQADIAPNSGNFDKSNVAALVLPLVTTSALGLLY